VKISFIIGTCLFLLFSCGRKGKKSVRVSVNTVVTGATTSSSSSSGPNWGLTTPTAASDFNCFGVVVEYSDQAQENECADEDFNVLVRPHELLGTVPSGTVLEAELREAQNVTFTVFGWKSNTGSCPDPKVDNIDSIQDQLSAPVILGHTTGDIASGDNDVNLTASMTNAKVIASCNGPLFDFNHHFNENCDPNKNSLADSTTEFAAGTGTSSDPYIICNAQQLRLIPSQSDPTGLWAKHFLLGRDLDLIDAGSDIYPWAPIATCPDGSSGCSKTFTGSFDGNYHKINNLQLNSTTYYEHSGLFGNVSAGATITSLRLDNVDISARQKTGAIAGVVKGTPSGTPTTIKDIFVSGTVFTNSWGQGGIIGKIYNGDASIRNIVNHAQVSNNNNSNGTRIGGIVGSVQVPSGNTVNIREVVNYGNVDTVLNSNGGIIGTIPSTHQGTLNITDVSNRGNVTGRTYTGGIVGRADGGGSASTNINTSFNTGSVSIFGGGGSVGNFGGILGRMSSNVTLHDSFTTGAINFSSSVSSHYNYGWAVGSFPSVASVAPTNVFFYSGAGGSNHPSGSQAIDCNRGTGTIADCTGIADPNLFYDTTHAIFQNFNLTDVWESISGDYPKLKSAQGWQ
jgi:hypothetical protein